MMILMYLVGLSIYDLKEKRIPVILLAFGILAAAATGIYEALWGSRQWASLIAAMIPGVFWLFMAWSSQKAGIADGIVLLVLGLALGERDCSMIFTVSLLLFALSAMILLAMRKVRRNSCLPYIPFLCAGFLIWRLWA